MLASLDLMMETWNINISDMLQNLQLTFNRIKREMLTFEEVFKDAGVSYW